MEIYVSLHWLTFSSSKVNLTVIHLLLIQSHRLSLPPNYLLFSLFLFIVPFHSEYEMIFLREIVRKMTLRFE